MIRNLILVLSVITMGCSKEPNPPPVSNATAPIQISAVVPPLAIDGGTDNSVVEPRDLRDELNRFIQSPTRETYLEIRAMIVASNAYEPYSSEITTAIELYERQKYELARDVLHKAMPNLMISPRVHQMLGFIYHKLGDAATSQMEMMIARTCVDGILATGDGSPSRPYLVVRRSDEHDVIEHLKKDVELQSLASNDDKHLDMIRCTDGTEYWFDITDAYKQLALLNGK